MKLKQVLAAVGIFAATSTQATENMYGIFGVGFAEAEFNDVSVDSASYKFGVGYQFHRQWYVEFGYQQLADESLMSQPVNFNDVQNFESGMQGDALFAALLGKASGNLGELFYRVGVVKADIKSQTLHSGVQSCELGGATNIDLGADGQYTYCEYDEGVIGGVFGIGFDYFIGPRSMIRTEVEHISGENGLSTNAAYIGFRYNF